MNLNNVCFITSIIMSSVQFHCYYRKYLPCSQKAWGARDLRKRLLRSGEQLTAPSCCLAEPSSPAASTGHQHRVWGHPPDTPLTSLPEAICNKTCSHSVSLLFLQFPGVPSHLHPPGLANWKRSQWIWNLPYPCEFPSPLTTQLCPNTLPSWNHLISLNYQVQSPQCRRDEDTFGFKHISKYQGSISTRTQRAQRLFTRS